MQEPIAKNQATNAVANTGMTYEQWVAAYQPKPRPHGPDRGLDGCMLETFGADLDRVLHEVNQGDPNKVWTLVECGDEDNTWMLSNGYHLVNRIGYAVTEIPFVPGEGEKAVLDVVVMSDADFPELDADLPGE